MRNASLREPLRVLFMDHTAMVGGGEIALMNLVKNLDRNLISPVVLLWSDGPLVRRMSSLAETHVLEMDAAVTTASKDQLGWKSLLRVRAVWKVFVQIWRVARFSRRHRFDLLHTNSLKSDIIGGIAGRIAGIPVVWHVRDRIESDYLPVSVVRWFRRLCRVVPSYVIANSEATLATLRLRQAVEGRAIPSGIELDSRVRVVHDGIDAEGARETRAGNFRLRIGLIGRISPWKGQHIYLHAAAQVLRDFPQARFEIIGAPLFAELDYERSLRELCRDLEIENSVEFVGFVENVQERIHHLDVVVHASTTGEPFGQVIIEGMAAGKPVVATNGGGVPEIVEDGITGLLVPMGDVTSMAQAIGKLLGDSAWRERMGQAGKERVIRQFTIQHTARKVEGVYWHVLGVAG